MTADAAHDHPDAHHGGAAPPAAAQLRQGGVIMIRYGFLKRCSFTHSTIYFGLLFTWAAGFDGVKYYFGWGHGIGWIVMCCLSLVALRQRVIGFRLAALITIGGAVGPFMGSIAFLRHPAPPEPGAKQGSAPRARPAPPEAGAKHGDAPRARPAPPEAGAKHGSAPPAHFAASEPSAKPDTSPRSRSSIGTKTDSPPASP